MGPQVGTAPQTCTFTTPANLPNGTYSLYVSSVGVQSKNRVLVHRPARAARAPAGRAARAAPTGRRWIGAAPQAAPPARAVPRRDQPARAAPRSRRPRDRRYDRNRRGHRHRRRDGWEPAELAARPARRGVASTGGQQTDRAAAPAPAARTAPGATVGGTGSGGTSSGGSTGSGGRRQQRNGQRRQRRRHRKRTSGCSCEVASGLSGTTTGALGLILSGCSPFGAAARRAELADFDRPATAGRAVPIS